MAKFTEKQLHFVECYEGNATVAAIRAGYSKKSAYSQGHRLLKNAEILKALQEKQNESTSKHVADVTERKEILTSIATGDDDKTKVKAIDVLNKMDALYIQKVELDVTQGKSRQEILMGAAEELRKEGWTVEPPK